LKHEENRTANQFVTNLTPKLPDSDPPLAFEAAERRFARFLAQHSYPTSICWLMPGSVLVSTVRRYYVRMNRPEALELARRRYSHGLQLGLEIALNAVCNSGSETFATVIVPTDDLDRQYHLTGKMLKLSCPLDQVKAIFVTSPVRWRILDRRHGERSKLLEL
jgi:hypothetical protein